jgi:hypothetical protein
MIVKRTNNVECEFQFVDADPSCDIYKFQQCFNYISNRYSSGDAIIGDISFNTDDNTGKISSIKISFTVVMEPEAKGYHDLEVKL